MQTCSLSGEVKPTKSDEAGKIKRTFSHLIDFERKMVGEWGLEPQTR